MHYVPVSNFSSVIKHKNILITNSPKNVLFHSKKYQLTNLQLCAINNSLMTICCFLPKNTTQNYKYFFPDYLMHKPLSNFPA